MRAAGQARPRACPPFVYPFRKLLMPYRSRPKQLYPAPGVHAFTLT
jgi:hypothetical protein